MTTAKQNKVFAMLPGLLNTEHAANLMCMKSSPSEVQNYAFIRKNEGQAPLHSDPMCSIGVNIQGEGSKLKQYVSILVIAMLWGSVESSRALWWSVECYSAW